MLIGGEYYIFDVITSKDINGYVVPKVFVFERNPTTIQKFLNLVFRFGKNRSFFCGRFDAFRRQKIEVNLYGTKEYMDWFNRVTDAYEEYLKYTNRNKMT